MRGEGQAAGRKSRAWLLIASAAGIAGFLALLALAAYEIRRTHSPAGPGWRRDRLTRRAVPLPLGIGWRNDGTAIYPDARPPLHWSATENVLWRIPLPSRSNATPVLWKDRLFLTAEPDLVIAVRASDGATLWEHHVPALEGLPPEKRALAEKLLADAEGLDRKLPAAMAELAGLKRDARKDNPPPGIHEHIAALQQSIASMEARVTAAAPYAGTPDASYIGDAAQTPVTDGQWVYVAFGSSAAAAFDLEGKRKWLVTLPHPAPDLDKGERRGIGPSPILAADRLIVSMIRLFGLNPETGQIIWSRGTYPDWGTTARATLGATDVIITSDGDFVRAEDGEVLFQVTTPVQFTGPILTGKHVIFAGQPRSHGVFDLVAGTTGPQAGSASSGHSFMMFEGDFSDDDAQPFVLVPKWVDGYGPPELRGTPVVSDNRIFAVDTDGLLMIVSVETGEMLLKRKLKARGSIVPNLVIAGGTLFVFTEGGEALLLKTEPPFAEVAYNELENDDMMRASPVFDGDRIYVRTYKYLYCLSASGRP